MGIIAILLALGAGFGVWMYRARNAAEATQTVLDMASDAKAAARRFGYKRKMNSNPLDNIDDPRLSVAGMLVALARLDGDLSRDQIEAITRECIETFQVDSAEAADMTAFGRWLSQHGEPEEVLRRLARVENGEVSERQTRALEMVHRTFT